MIIKNTPKLFFLDIDGTLIQENQLPNSNGLPQLISEMSEKGHLFGLNSNRSLEDVTGIYKTFGLNGPIILENGVYFKDSLEGIDVFLTTNHAERLQFFVEQAVEEFINKNNLKAKGIVGDTVELIKNKKFTDVDCLFLINGFRKYTASIHVYRNGIRDKKMAHNLGVYLRAFLKKQGLNVEVDIPKAFGNVIIFPVGVDKNKALKKIKGFYRGYKFVMIGDDDGDIVSAVDFVFAVGNAQAGLKAKADYVSSAEYTAGVEDIIRYAREKYD